MRQTIVIYHRSDFDGIFCREIARKFLTAPTTQFIGWDYGDPVPDVPLDAMLYMLDISVEPLMTHPGLVWVDHHKSAIERYAALSIPGYQLDGVAACRLAWWYFFGVGDSTAGAPTSILFPTLEDFRERRVSEPWAVRLAGEYDVWDRRDPDAEVFQFGLRSEPEVRWDVLLSTNISGFYADYVLGLLEQGHLLKSYQERQDADIVRANWFRLDWEGLTFIGCCHARFNSHLFDAVIPDVVADALLGFRFDGSKGLWVVSMYHPPDHTQHDLSAIATRHGGGGHRGACGFTCRELPFQLPTTR